MSEETGLKSGKIGEIQVPNGTRLDVVLSGHWQPRFWRMDLTISDGRDAGKSWTQVGKNIEGYTPPDDKRDYVLIKDYSENRGLLDLLCLANLVEVTGRHISAGRSFLVECVLADGIEREYEFDTQWMMSGTSTATAKTRQQAEQKLYDSGNLPTGAYVPDSFLVDTDTFIEFVNPDGTPCQYWAHHSKSVRG